jgi:hypothetical protein
LALISMHGDRYLMIPIVVLAHNKNLLKPTDFKRYLRYS